MVAIIVAIAILIYVASIVIMCHNAMPYDKAWDETEVKQYDSR